MIEISWWMLALIVCGSAWIGMLGVALCAISRDGGVEGDHDSQMNFTVSHGGRVINQFIIREVGEPDDHN